MSGLVEWVLNTCRSCSAGEASDIQYAAADAACVSLCFPSVTIATPKSSVGGSHTQHPRPSVSHIATQRSVIAGMSDRLDMVVNFIGFSHWHKAHIRS